MTSSGWSKRGKVAATIVIALTLQVIAITIYLQVEQHRKTTRQPQVASRRPPVSESSRFERFVVERGDGEVIDLARVKHPTVVHFWATWCPPCRWELPAYFAFASSRSPHALAISLDAKREDTQEFTADASPNLFGFGDASAAQDAFGIRELPVTLLIEPGGRVTLRAQGARDWRDADFAARWSRGEE